MPSVKKNKIKYFIFLIFFIAGLIYVLFNDSGLLKYLKLKKQLNELNEQISTVNSENKQIQDDIDSLQNKIPAKIEEVAREKYGMIRKGEKTIKIIEVPSDSLKYNTKKK